MTVASTTNRIAYTASAAQTIFPYTFKIFADADLDVYVDGVLKTLTTHYTVSGAGSPGGNVTFVTGMAGGESVIIYRVIDATQGVDLVENDIFPSASVEDALDRITMLSQQNGEGVTRALRIPETDITAIDGTIPSESSRASRYLAFDATGLPIASLGPLGTSTLPISSYIETLLDDANAATARTTLGATGEDDVVLKSIGTGPTYVRNIGLTATVAAKALTIALKTKALTDPIATDQVDIAFRNTTVTTGDYVVRQITSATSLVVPDGACLGFIGASVYCYIAVFMCDDGTVQELGVCGNPSLYDESYLYNTTAISASADTSGVLYTTSTLTNASIRRIGTIEIVGGAVTGEWDNAPLAIDLTCRPTQMAKRLIASASTGSVASLINVATFTPAISVIPGDIIILNYTGGIVTGAGACVYSIQFNKTGTASIDYTSSGMPGIHLQGPAVLGAGTGAVCSGTFMFRVTAVGTIATIGSTSAVLYGTAGTLFYSMVHAEIWRQH